MVGDIIQERYVNPYTDFGFKKLFGTAMNKELLISFLNALFSGREVVRDITYLNSEHLGSAEPDRKAVFDVYCENERGEKFIAEIQKGEQQFFKDRSIYYATFPIREQAKRGEWDYELKAVYTVAILNFTLDDTNKAKECFHEVKLLDTQTHEVFYDTIPSILTFLPFFLLSLYAGAKGLTNAGRTRSLGGELSLQLSPWRSLDIHLAYGYTDARFVRYRSGNEDYAGMRVPYAPEHTFSAAATWSRPTGVAWLGDVVVQAGVQGAGPIQWNEENTLTEPFYALMNATIRLEHRRWSLGVWGRNLTGTNYNVFYFKSIGNEFVQRGRPRTFGITLTLQID